MNQKIEENLKIQKIRHGVKKIANTQKRKTMNLQITI